VRKNWRCFVPILTPNDVGGFLGLPADSPGLPEAIEQAELLTAAEMGLRVLDLREYVDEGRVLRYRVQQILPNHGPVQELTAFEYEGKDRLADVSFTPWNITFTEPLLAQSEFAWGVRTRTLRSFSAGAAVKYTYKAGWTNRSGEYPIPPQVAAYVMSMTGLVYLNLLASGVYDTKLGDMTMRINRETLNDNLAMYRAMLRMHGRPYFGG
jgi:hypothetical protein